MTCPECGFALSGDERVCPRCLAPIDVRGEPKAVQASRMPLPDQPREGAPAIDMTERMRRLMRGPLWTTRRLQLALTVFLLLVAAAVLGAVCWSVWRQDAAYYAARGAAHDDQGQYEPARAGYLRSLAAEPDQAEVESKLGWVYLKLWQPSLAIPHLDRAVLLDAELGKAHRGLGVAYAEAGMNVEAEASLKRALQLDKDDTGALSTLGRVYYQQQRYEETIEALEQVIDKDGQDAEALAYLGRALYALGRYDEAVHPLEAAFELDPNVDAVRAYLGRVWFALARYDKALAHFRFLQAAHPDDPAWHAYVGRALYEQGDRTKAAAHLAHAVALAQADLVLGTANCSLAQIRYEEQRYEEAAALFQRALIVDPLDAEAMAGLGWCYAELERCSEALPLFEAALEIDPHSEQARAGAQACPTEPEVVAEEP